MASPRALPPAHPFPLVLRAAFWGVRCLTLFICDGALGRAPLVSRQRWEPSTAAGSQLPSGWVSARSFTAVWLLRRDLASLLPGLTAAGTSRTLNTALECGRSFSLNRAFQKASLHGNSTSGLLTGSDLFTRLTLSGLYNPRSHTSKNSWLSSFRLCKRGKMSHQTGKSEIILKISQGFSELQALLVL